MIASFADDTTLLTVDKNQEASIKRLHLASDKIIDGPNNDEYN